MLICQTGTHSPDRNLQRCFSGYTNQGPVIMLWVCVMCYLGKYIQGWPSCVLLGVRHLAGHKRAEQPKWMWWWWVAIQDVYCLSGVTLTWFLWMETTKSETLYKTADQSQFSNCEEQNWSLNRRNLCGFKFLQISYLWLNPLRRTMTWMTENLCKYFTESFC